jgi:hypothetical protein
MTSAIKPAATRVLNDSELNTVAGGLLTPCGWSGCDSSYYTPTSPPPTTTWSGCLMRQRYRAFGEVLLSTTGQSWRRMPRMPASWRTAPSIIGMA